MIKRKYDFEPYTDNCMVTKRQKDLDYLHNFSLDAKLPITKRQREPDNMDGINPKKYKQFDNLVSMQRNINFQICIYYSPTYTKIIPRQYRINPQARIIDLIRKIAANTWDAPHRLMLVYKGRPLSNNELLFDELFDANPAELVCMQISDFGFIKL